MIVLIMLISFILILLYIYVSYKMYNFYLNINNRYKNIIEIDNLFGYNNIRMANKVFIYGFLSMVCFGKREYVTKYSKIFVSLPDEELKCNKDWQNYLKYSILWFRLMLVILIITALLMYLLFY